MTAEEIREMDLMDAREGAQASAELTLVVLRELTAQVAEIADVLRRIRERP